MSGSGGTVRARYRIASHGPLEQAAQVLAGEQSSGTFTAVARESAVLHERHGARVVALTADDGPVHPLPGSWNGARHGSVASAVVDIELPVENFGTSAIGLLNTVAGNIFELGQLAAVKLLDVEIPAGVVAASPGPRHGLAGTRALTGVARGPVLGTIVKPSVGLPLDQLAELVRELAEAGIDFIKDDELHGDAPYSPLRDRIEVVSAVLDDVAQSTGKRTMYAFNISGSVEHMLNGADRVAEYGGSCVMVTVATVGLSAVEHLRRCTDLVIHGHRAGFQAMSRSAELGVDFVAWQKFARLAGVDQLHVGGVNSKFFESNESVVASIRALLQPLGPLPAVAPVLSSAQSAVTAEATYALTSSVDLMVLAGGGITGHPGGVAEGVASMREAWAAAVQGVPLAVAAASSDVLSRAVEHFGGGAQDG